MSRRRSKKRAGPRAAEADLNFKNRIVGEGVQKASLFRANPLNYRTHPQAQRDAVHGSLSELGWIQRVIVNRTTGNLVDGHERVWQALANNDADVPFVEVELSEGEEKLALAVLDPLSAMAETDAKMLDSLLREVSTGDAALQELLSGLAKDAGILDGNGETTEDEVPEPPVDPVAKVGDLWLLGDHRLLCGDSTKAGDVERVMGGERWNCMVTDPPYGVAYEGGRNPESNTPRRKLKGDGNAMLYAAFLPAWKPHRQAKGVIYLWFAGRCGSEVYCAAEASGFEVRALIIWNKLDAHYGNFMAQYMQKHEPCLYCVMDGSEWNGPTNEVTVWDIKQPSKNEHHPTEKPVECMGRAIRNSTKERDLVVDAFSGSGTTLIAAEQLNRRCFAIEIEPRYVDVAVLRWEKLTGKKATVEHA